MRILIYGAGAVGCYIGGQLCRAGHDVVLLGRERLAKAVASQGLTLRLADDSTHILHTIRAVDTLDAALAGPPFDWIAFTMKAYDTVEALWALYQKLPQPPPLVSFQNGIGNEETLRGVFGQDAVVAGTLTSPVSMLAPAEVVEEKRRGIAVATDVPAIGPVLEALRQTDLTVQTVAISAALKWSKLLLNMVGNAVPAILDVPPAEVFGDPRLFAIERLALNEALAMLELMNIPVVNLPGAAARTLAIGVRWLPPFALRPMLRQKVAGGRGAKLPSLLKALRDGQRRTEVAWLNGAVAQAADSMKRIVPVNHALALTVSDIAAGRVPWDAYRHNTDMLFASIRIATGLS
jgi:2-dehydropantoate 2-reductase